MNANEAILYLKMDERVEVVEPVVSLNVVAQLECSNKKILQRVKDMMLLKFQEKQYGVAVVSILKIYEKIHEVYPFLQIENLGACDVIITYENQRTPSRIVHLVKAFLVFIISFIGAAYSIMAFSNDVDTLDIFDLIYELIVGKKAVGFTTLEVSYCIGLIVGIVVFFNHVGKKKLTADPTPMEIEMRLYEQDIQTTLVQNYSRRGDEIDVGDTGNINHHGS